jgi:hypothetical protein
MVYTAAAQITHCCKPILTGSCYLMLRVLHQIWHRRNASPMTTNRWYDEETAGQPNLVSKKCFCLPGICTEIVYAFFISLMRPACSVYISFVDLITLIGPVFGEKYKLWGSSHVICSIIVTSSLRSRASSVSTVTRLWFGRGNNLCLRHCVQTGSGVHPASYVLPNGYRPEAFAWV